MAFRGCPCSDAAGRQFCFSDIQRMVRRGGGGSSGDGGSSSGGGGGSSGSDLNSSNHTSAGLAGGEGGGLAADAGDTHRGRHELLNMAMGTRGEEDVVCEEPQQDAQQASPYTRCHLATETGGHRYQVGWRRKLCGGRMQGASAASCGHSRSGNSSCITFAGGTLCAGASAARRICGLRPSHHTHTALPPPHPLSVSSSLPSSNPRPFSMCVIYPQVWFDDPASLAQKAALAAELGLRGVGVWNLDCLDYECEDPKCKQDTEAMWGALRAAAAGARGQGSAAGSRGTENVGDPGVVRE